MNNRGPISRAVAEAIATEARQLYNRMDGARALERLHHLATHQLPTGEWECGQIKRRHEDGRVDVWGDTLCVALTPYEAVEQAAAKAEAGGHPLV